MMSISKEVHKSCLEVFIYFLFVCQEQRRQYNCQMEEATQAEAAMVNV